MKRKAKKKKKKRKKEKKKKPLCHGGIICKIKHITMVRRDSKRRSYFFTRTKKYKYKSKDLAGYQSN